MDTNDIFCKLLQYLRMLFHHLHSCWPWRIGLTLQKTWFFKYAPNMMVQSAGNYRVYSCHCFGRLFVVQFEQRPVRRAAHCGWNAAHGRQPSLYSACRSNSRRIWRRLVCVNLIFSNILQLLILSPPIYWSLELLFILGKSFLLAVIILYMARLIVLDENRRLTNPVRTRPWKILVRYCYCGTALNDDS